MTLFSRRINVRITQQDWDTIVAIDQARPNARPITLTHQPNVSEALRTLFRHWRSTEARR
jgi:hypothetical protein